MPGLSLREAAGQAGTSKSTILRAIQSGRLSANRTDEGGYSIDPSELNRVYPARSAPVAGERHADRSTGQDASPPAPPVSSEATVELRVRNATLEAELSALRLILEVERRRAEELREDRDGWRSQAERLALPLPDSQKPLGWFRRALRASA